MATTYYDKQRATARIGEELRRRGWTILGYREDKSDSMTDYWCPANWEGIATHPDYPDVVVVINNQGRLSGKVQTREVSNPVACHACNGTGVAADALSYSEAQQNPTEAHRRKAETIEGVRFVPFIGQADPNYISRRDYFDDGRPRCLNCMGKTTVHKRTVEVEFTWPTFLPNPRGRAWHVERSGVIIASGTGFAKCSDYSEKDAHHAVSAVCDEIESAARRGRTPTTPTSAEQPSVNATGLCAKATGGNITVLAEHDEAKGWTYLRLEPRIDRSTYDAFATRFNVKWHRMRRMPVLYRLVGADELATFFGPVVGNNQPAVEPEAPPAAVEITHRYILVKRGSGPLYRDVDSGAEDIHLRAGYAVLQVIADKADYLLAQIRSGMAHLSPILYDSVEAADADAPNHLITPLPAPTPEPFAAEIEAALERKRIMATATIKMLTDRYQRQDLPNNPEIVAHLQSLGTDLVPGVRLQDAIETVIWAVNGSDEEFAHYVQNLYLENRVTNTPTPPKTRQQPQVIAFTNDEIGGGRSHFHEEFHDKDWTTLHKARKAAQARADQLRPCGWQVTVERANLKYMVRAHDPAYTTYKAVIGGRGMVGESEDGRIRWTLSTRRQPGDPALTPTPAAPTTPETTPEAPTTPETTPEAAKPHFGSTVALTKRRRAEATATPSLQLSLL